MSDLPNECFGSSQIILWEAEIHLCKLGVLHWSFMV